MVSGVILAAGLSSRMGSPKQLLPYRDTTLLGHVLDVASRTSLGELVLVTSRPTGARAELQAHPTVRHVVNLHPTDGQSGSLKLGIAAVSADASGALILMSDQPGITVELINRMIEEFETTPMGALVPTYRGHRGSPVLLCQSFWPLLSSLRGDTGARELLSEHPELVRTIEVEHLGNLRDIDTPEQYSQLLERAGPC